jgi:hypothetical protein
VTVNSRVVTWLSVRGRHDVTGRDYHTNMTEVYEIEKRDSAGTMAVAGDANVAGTFLTNTVSITATGDLTSSNNVAEAAMAIVLRPAFLPIIRNEE